MTRRGLILLGVMAVFWGIPSLFIRIAVDEITPASLVFVRTAIGATILLPIAAVQWRGTVPSPGALIAIVTLGVFCTAIAFLSGRAMPLEVEVLVSFDRDTQSGVSSPARVQSRAGSPWSVRASAMRASTPARRRR